MPTASSSDDARDRFFQAIEAGDRAQVERLLAVQPALVNSRNASGVSATLFSLYYREPEIAELLANAGAEMSVFEAAALGRVEKLAELLATDPTQANAVASDGFAPLGLAAFFGQPDAARTLLDHGANPNVASQNAMRVTPLHSAVAAQRLDISEDLLRRGADVNASQADDFTPLHEAAQNGQVPMIELLLAHGADLTARKSDGQTALDVAEAAGQDAAAALLRERGR
ncbi:MAG TPA: ankyrin repeat domain-containing protein [Ktedonobacterales bacterium]|jgi:ankyrin repeat protein|nr:ankyrin repeat domain-containing protein [Ktedonobacterales bacterium]